MGMAHQERESDLVVKKYQLEIVALAEGFFPFSVLSALLQLDIFRRIERGVGTLSGLALDLNVREDVLSRVLNAGVALGFLQLKDAHSFEIGESYRPALSPSAGEAYLGDWLINLDFFRDAMSRLDEAVCQAGPSVDPSWHIGAHRKTTADFARAMHNYANVRGEELADVLDMRGCRTLLDVGCGPGTQAFQLAKRNAGLDIYLLDLPEVLEHARELQRGYELPNEVYYLGRDALKADIPGSYDVVLVSNTLHCLGEDASRTLLRRLYRNVNAGGSLVVQAQFLREDRLGGRWPVFLDLIQLCVTSQGRNHSKEETVEWLKDAGFTRVEYHRMNLLNTNSFLRGFK